MAKARSKVGSRVRPKVRAPISRRMVWITAVVIVVMFSFGFIMSPLYDALCRVMGTSAKPVRADTEVMAAKVDETRTVTVEFTGNTIAGLPWEFRPLTKKIVVHPGAMTTVTYYARNPSSETVVGQAAPSVTPMLASDHFKKIECFCFTQQKLLPGEAREMPVKFYVDSALPRNVHTITLSYGFFNIDKTQAARFGGTDGPMPVHDHSEHGGHGKVGS